MTTIQPGVSQDVRIGEPDLQHQIELISNVNVEAFVIRIKIQYFGDALFRERIVGDVQHVQALRRNGREKKSPLDVGGYQQVCEEKRIRCSPEKAIPC